MQASNLLLSELNSTNTKHILLANINFSFVLFFIGEVYTWGDNDEGQLGDGSTSAIQRPRLVPALTGNFIFLVFRLTIYFLFHQLLIFFSLTDAGYSCVH